MANRRIEKQVEKFQKCKVVYRQSIHNKKYIFNTNIGVAKHRVTPEYHILLENGVVYLVSGQFIDAGNNKYGCLSSCLGRFDRLLKNKVDTSKVYGKKILPFLSEAKKYIDKKNIKLKYKV